MSDVQDAWPAAGATSDASPPGGWSAPVMGPTTVGSGSSFEADRARLLAEIAEARDRVVAATRRAAARDEAAREAVRSELLAARRLLSEIEQDHHDAVAAVRADGASEVERIRATAGGGDR